MHTLSKNTLSLAIALSALAGCVDAIGFMQLSGHFVSFMSGNSTQLAIGLQQGDWPAVHLLFSIICCFIIGTIFGTVTRNRLAKNKAVGVLTMVTLLIAAAALCNSRGAVTASMLLIALAMGSENSVLQSNNRNLIGVTYMTGTLVKVGQHIALAFLPNSGKFSWLPYLLLWLGLITGGITGAFLFLHYGLLALWFPAAWSCLLTGLLRLNWSRFPGIE